MRTRIALLSVGCLVLASAQTQAGITGSKHDFHSQTWASGQICLPCHAPHNNINSTGQLLWNHTASSASYTFYNSPTMNATAPTSMSEISKTCMGCHDGTVAVDSFGGTNGTTTISTANNLGTNLGNDHPISITYNSTVVSADKHLHAITDPSGLGSTIDADLLYAGKVECNSCHDVHNAYGIPGMLKKSNASSALCLTCHDK